MCVPNNVAPPTVIQPEHGIQVYGTHKMLQCIRQKPISICE